MKRSMLSTESDENPKKKRKIMHSKVRKSKTSSKSVKKASQNKESMTFMLFRTSSTDLSKKKQRSLALRPYLCENLPKKHVVSYASVPFRVDLKVLRPFSPKLSKQDVKVIEWAQREGKNWDAHRLGRPHRLRNPINAEKEGREMFKYLSDDHPIIVELLKDNQKAREYANEYQISWVLVSIKASLETAIVSGDKRWEFRKGISIVPKKDERAIESSMQNAWSYAKQDLSKKSNNKQIERGKIYVRYLNRIIKGLHDYVVERADESTKSYFPRRDSKVIYVGNHLKQFNITLDQAFSAVPFKLSARKYKSGEWRRKHRPEWDELMAKYNPGTYEAMS